MLNKTVKYSLLVLFILSCLFITGCIFVDDGCYYETKCNYITQCETVCDAWEYNCMPSNCYEVLDRCWDEYICYD